MKEGDECMKERDEGKGRRKETCEGKGREKEGEETDDEG